MSTLNRGVWFNNAYHKVHERQIMSRKITPLTYFGLMIVYKFNIFLCSTVNYVNRSKSWHKICLTFFHLEQNFYADAQIESYHELYGLVRSLHQTVSLLHENRLKLSHWLKDQLLYLCLLTSFSLRWLYCLGSKI